MSVILKTDHVNVRSGKKYLLHDVSWEVQEGEHWLVFGMNGSGKTTLLSLIAGFRSASSGTVELFGQQYARDSIFQLRKQIGWVSSSFFDKYYHDEPSLQIILSGLTGTLNIDDTITDEDIRRAKSLLRALNMMEKMNAPFSSMSKGERQNILIARALINRPKILVMDEPGTGLDIYAREKMKNIVRDLANSNHVTILYVTHYPEEIQSFMNKTLVLRNGCVFAKGNTEDVFHDKNISRLLGEPVQVSKNTDGSYAVKLKAESDISRLCYEEVLSCPITEK